MVSDADIALLHRRIDEQNKLIDRLTNQNAPTVPIYDLTGGTAQDSTPGSTPQDVLPGQIAVSETDDALHWVNKDGDWKTTPAGSGAIDTLFLWSSWDDGDSNVTVPAYTGFGGVLYCAYEHIRFTNTFWNNFQLNGSIVTSPPYDRVVVPPGEYLVDAWWLFIDDFYNTWLGTQLNLIINGGTIFPNRYYTKTRQVDGPGTYSGADPQNPGYTGQFETGAHSFTVPAGKTGSIYTNLFHADNHTIDLRQNWVLGIHKLS